MHKPKMPEIPKQKKKIQIQEKVFTNKKRKKNEITVKSSALTPAVNAAALSSSIGSVEKTRFNSEKINGASGLD